MSSGQPDLIIEIQQDWPLAPTNPGLGIAWIWTATIQAKEFFCLRYLCPKVQVVRRQQFSFRVGSLPRMGDWRPCIPGFAIVLPAARKFPPPTRFRKCRRIRIGGSVSPVWHAPF